MKHTKIKSHELLNSEGPIITIIKDSQYWHWKFHGSQLLVITNPNEILNFLSGKSMLIDPNGKTYNWMDYSMSMKGDDPERIRKIVIELIQEELDLCKSNIEYFEETYLLK